MDGGSDSEIARTLDRSAIHNGRLIVIVISTAFSKLSIQLIPNWSVNMVKRAAQDVSCGGMLIFSFFTESEKNLSVS